jgi:hypothetical protein
MAVFDYSSLASERFPEMLSVFLAKNGIDTVYDGRNLLATAIYHYVSYFSRERPAVLLANIEHIVNMGGDPHFCRTVDDLRYASCVEVALIWGRLELFKILVQSRKFRLHKLNKSSFFVAGQCPQMANYFARIETEYQHAVQGGISYVANYVNPLSPMLLLNALSGKDRGSLKKMHRETEELPSNLRAVFFNKESNAARLSADVAVYIAAFLIQSADKKKLLREYFRMLKI